jgi:vacuolar iron transporter family protein
MEKIISPEQRRALLAFQRAEITEYHIYAQLAKATRNEENSKILSRIANEEKAHSELWKSYTQTEVKPSKIKITWYYWISRILGLTFGIKLMERGENKAQNAYGALIESIPEARQIIQEEDVHEQMLINMIDEERLQYVGSMVLGLNDALIELTGVLAGLSLAMQNTKLIAMAGLITGIAAAFSMAASDYLSKKADGNVNAGKSATYTGIAYIITVALLIAPYLIFNHYLLCLGITFSIVILIILGFNFYISVAKDLNFKRRFFEMAFISLGVAALTFGVGFLVKEALGVNI